MRNLQDQINDLEEQLAFWVGEGQTKTREEQEWLEIQRVESADRTPEQTERIRFLGRFMMEADASYWKNRAAKAEKELESLKP
jgi:hypothetical protein